MPRKEVDRPPYYRFLTHRLEQQVFAARCRELAVIVADNDLNLTRVAVAVDQPARAVRRWVKCARDRGQDVVPMAREILRERGVETRELLAERVRQGMRPGKNTRPANHRNQGAKCAGAVP